MKKKRVKSVYIFDITGELICRFNSLKTFKKSRFHKKWFLNYRKPRISTNFNQNCLRAKLFITHDKNFQVDYYGLKKNHNPLKADKWMINKYGEKDNLYEVVEANVFEIWGDIKLTRQINDENGRFMYFNVIKKMYVRKSLYVDEFCMTQKIKYDLHLMNEFFLDINSEYKVK